MISKFKSTATNLDVDSTPPYAITCEGTERYHALTLFGWLVPKHANNCSDLGLRLIEFGGMFFLRHRASDLLAGQRASLFFLCNKRVSVVF